MIEEGKKQIQDKIDGKVEEKKVEDQSQMSSER